MRVGLVIWIAVGMVAAFGATAVAQSVTPPPVESPPIPLPGASPPPAPKPAPSRPPAPAPSRAPAPAASPAPAPSLPSAEDPRPGEALTACASGQVAKGIDVLATLYAETRNPSFVFNQARCYQQNGQLEKSRERFREYLRVGKNEPPADIQRAEGFIKELDRELALQRAVQDARPQERRYRGALRTTSIVLAATGVAAIGAGVLLGYQMKQKEDQIARQFEPNRPGRPGQRPGSRIWWPQGTRLETWQYISYGVGVAALAGAATTFGLSGWTFRDEVTVTPVLAGDQHGWDCSGSVLSSHAFVRPSASRCCRRGRRCLLVRSEHPEGQFAVSATSRECPRGYLCEQVVLAADRRVWTCCAQPGMHRADPAGEGDPDRHGRGSRQRRRRRQRRRVDAPPSTLRTRTPACGNDKVEPGETCDPPGTCPTSCPPSGCMRRKLEGSAASCTARCVEDTPQTACMTGDSCCPAGCAGMDEDCSCTCGNGTVEASCGEKCDPVGNCPASCPNVACMKRKLLNAGGCQAECVDDGVETACMNGDGCCPPVCNSTTDTDCTARCGNGVREGNEKCDGTDCPTSCPAMGCQRRKLQGSAAQCDAECVNDEVISMCGNGDGCCPPACNRNNDAECTCSCGNGIVEAACGEKCEGAGCPGSCPPQGCQLRKLQGTACTAECVPDGMRTACANGDGCCPGGCTANNDNDCQPRCGNGAVEAGETCDPSSVCRMQSDACTSDANFVRTRSGNVNSCTFRCTSVGPYLQRQTATGPARRRPSAPPAGPAAAPARTSTASWRTGRPAPATASA